jgi:hypothetical protein
MAAMGLRRSEMGLAMGLRQKRLRRIEDRCSRLGGDARLGGDGRWRG